MIKSPELNIEPKPELYAEYEAEKNEIRNLYNEMIQKSEDRSNESGRIEDFINPATLFRDVLKAKFTELGIEDDVKDYAAYHYSIGSSPNGKEKGFDTSDDLVLETLRKFSKTF